MLRRSYERLRALWTWRRRQTDLDDEIRFHLEEEVEERVAGGLSQAAARDASKRAFGNVTHLTESTREAWGWSRAERWVQDGRYALRAMRRDPGFSAVAIVTLALGIGATTAILVVVNALLLRPLPFVGADRLVMLFATSPKAGVFRDTTSFFDFAAWRDSGAFAAAAAFRRDPVIIGGEGAAEPLAALRASHELLTVLRVTPAMGRGFTAAEQRGEQQREQPVVLLGHDVWMRRYGGDPRILGRVVQVDEVGRTVVGVLPAGFRFPAFQDTDLIVPLTERPCRSCGYLRVVARLRDGIARTAAQDAVDTVAAGLAHAFPESNRDRGVNVVPLQEVAVGPARTPLAVLLGAGLFVLLTGCGNVGSLVLARGVARQRELAVRTALGAGVGRLVRQLLTESLLLAAIAAVLGTWLAWLGSRLLTQSLAQRAPLPAVSFDLSLPIFAVLIAMMSGLVTGLAPALTLWRSDLTDALRQNGRDQAGGSTSHHLRHLLVVAQTALTMMLLIGAGLLVRSFVRLQGIDVGLDTSRVLSADLMLPARHTEPARHRAIVRQLLDSVGALPGVRTSAIHVDQPFQGGGRRETFTIEHRDDPEPGHGHAAAFNIVSGAFFRAMDMTLVRGRAFDARDNAAGAPAAVVNETMARRFWPGDTATGKRLRYFYDKDPTRWITIVGVVRDVRYGGRLTEPVPQLFVPGEQPFYRALDRRISLVVRTVAAPATLAKSVQAAIQSVDRDVAILELQPLDETLRNEVAEPRTYTLLLGAFAAIALAIAMSGIYGVSAYAVVQRTREIGVRLAIGATPWQILSMVLHSGLRLTAVGVGLGLAGALALSRVLAGLFSGVTAVDASTCLVVTLLFAGVALASIYVPARRASRIDPAVAFRFD
jgi:putative ABC transport system permease protein